jgi:hypothetical protein
MSYKLPQCNKCGGIIDTWMRLVSTSVAIGIDVKYYHEDCYQKIVRNEGSIDKSLSDLKAKEWKMLQNDCSEP